MHTRIWSKNKNGESNNIERHECRSRVWVRLIGESNTQTMRTRKLTATSIDIFTFGIIQLNRRKIVLIFSFMEEIR